MLDWEDVKAFGIDFDTNYWLCSVLIGVFNCWIYLFLLFVLPLLKSKLHQMLALSWVILIQQEWQCFMIRSMSNWIGGRCTLLFPFLFKFCVPSQRVLIVSGLILLVYICHKAVKLYLAFYSSWIWMLFWPTTNRVTVERRCSTIFVELIFEWLILIERKNWIEKK